MEKQLYENKKQKQKTNFIQRDRDTEREREREEHTHLIQSKWPMGLLIQWPAKEITDKLFSNEVGMFVFGVSVGKTQSGEKCENGHQCSVASHHNNRWKNK